MKKIIFISLTSLLLFSCKEKPKQTEAKVGPEFHKELYGSWTGDLSEEDQDFFEGDVPNKLNINIKRITTDMVIAQSIVAGEIKPLIGKLEEKEGQLVLKLRQSPAELNNGTFEIKLVKDTLIGTWKAYKPSKELTNQVFKLLKKDQVYDAKLMLPGDYNFVDWGKPKTVKVTDTVNGKIESYESERYRSSTMQIFKLNASAALLNESDLKNLRKLDLEIIRNTIYARHGYAFKNKSTRQFFDPILWYVPIKENVDNELSSIEKKNIAMLMRFEKYATDNYDTFGR